MGVVFLTLLAAGFLGVLATCRLDQVAWNFVRLITMLSLSELSMAVAAYLGLFSGHLSRPALVACGLVFGSGLCAFIAMGLAPLGTRYAALIRVFALVGAILALAATAAWGIDQNIWPKAALATQLPVLLISMMLLGSVSLAMLLGHAYLTHTEMTIQPLRRLAALFAVSLALRAVAATLGGLACMRAMGSNQLVAEAARREMLVLVLRYVVGLVLPGVFCFMVLRTVKLRATQSATGILYFGLVLIYLGELAAIQLTRELHWPF